MTVAYPQRDTSDLAITWPDMRESFPCEHARSAVTPELWCHRAAEWVMRTACHPKVLLMCTQHKEELVAAESHVCWCGATFFIPGSTAYTSIEPLGVT